MINARAETVATLPAFRDYLPTRRCIIPATRFYEWRKVEKGKRPYSIQRNDGFPMSFAGLWAGWKDPESGEVIRSCTIITTTPNAVMEPLHDRMPVILDDEAVDLWLDPGVTDTATLQLVLQPCPDDALCTYPVSSLVNSPRNEGPELVAPSPALH